MAFPFKERIFTWAMPIALVGVLVVLAVLQYRWSREVSDAARTRMQNSLQNALMYFRGDLERELAMTCLDLQLDTRNPSGETRKIVDRFEHWRRTSSHPDLVANVYLWDPSLSEELLFHLDPARDRFEAGAWPARFQKLQDWSNSHFSYQMAVSSQPAASVGPKSSAGVSEQTASIVPGAIDETIPMLIVPAARSNHGRRTRANPLLLIELDRKVLQNSILPQLADRYFGAPASSEYAVAVTTDSVKDPQVLYSSEAGFGASHQVPDASLNLFGPPGVPSHNAAAPSAQSFRPWLGSPEGAGTRFSSTTNAGMFSELIRFDPIVYEPGQPAWQVVARNRQGSVALAVAGLRRRNLAVSFGVLAVLAGTMGLILFTSQRARRLARLQMDFVSGVSHELRTPIAAILAAAENISDGVVEDKQQVVRYAGMIRNQARQLNHLVEQVLRFAVTLRKAPYSGRPLMVSAVIEEALESTAILVREAGFAIDLDVAPDLPAVAADFEMLSQCLQNLITNAVKYGGTSKWIGIRAYCTPAEGQPEQISVVVQDRGIGIAPQEVGQIFEPFYRSPAVVASPIHGTGLGLTLARSFAETMGGTLTAESEIGGGTAFTIRLPVANQLPGEQSIGAGVAARQRLPDRT